ncbi:hypothetical protein qu_479 [Acanthamoeba polyphaga mimivirus]|nr:hypothetical protein [Mimivirus reunion]WMV61814.1 hypothetical protein qu_479 [Mimivirus sp.]WMV62791.1 hypothetical protein qu_479 [Acanthamoeba polyphaga mimivirus]WMV63768.1 hypothetical protein qu_479 [Mimivirus sp.]
MSVLVKRKMIETPISLSKFRHKRFCLPKIHPDILFETNDLPFFVKKLVYLLRKKYDMVNIDDNKLNTIYISTTINGDNFEVLLSFQKKLYINPDINFMAIDVTIKTKESMEFCIKQQCYDHIITIIEKITDKKVYANLPNFFYPKFNQLIEHIIDLNICKTFNNVEKWYFSKLVN